MSSYRHPSRLYRMLPDCPKPIFTSSHSGGFAGTDDTISAITINRGTTGGVAVGVSPSTLEITTPDYRSPSQGETLTCSLTAPAAAWLAARTGQTAAAITARFHGRVGRQRVRDMGERFESSMLASSWTAQLSHSPTKVSVVGGANVGAFLQNLMTRSYGDFIPPVRMDALADYGTIVQTGEADTFANLIGPYAEDYGLLIRDYRTGTPQIFTLKGRRSRALAAAQNMMPVARAQAYAPAEWDQANERYPRNHRILYTNTAGALESRTWGDAEDPNREVVQHDLSHIKAAPDQVTRLGDSLRRREWTGAYSLPTVTLDIARLLRRGRAADLIQAGQLLALSPGDPVPFAADWPFQVRGMQFAEGIREEISPAGWTITLSLVRYSHVIGEASPTVRPHTWDQAADLEWDAAPGTWDSY